MDIEIPFKATYHDGGHVPQNPLPGRMPTGSTQVPPKAPPPKAMSNTPDGWTRWEGGSCPVAPRAPIEIRSRAGNQHVGFAGSFRWTNTLTDGDIVSYRLLPELTRRRTDPKHVDPQVAETPAAGGQIDPYKSLRDVLDEALQQASQGKGAERHGNDLRFEDQRMLSITRLLKSERGLAYQVCKKVAEGLDLPTTDRKVAELLGAINYIAGIVIYIRETGGTK